MDADCTRKDTSGHWIQKEVNSNAFVTMTLQYGDHNVKAVQSRP